MTPAPRVRSLTLADYTNAREFFHAVRDASIEAWKEYQAGEMSLAREGVRAQSYGIAVNPGAIRDRMVATDARIDREAVMNRRVEEDYALMDLAVRLIYGEQAGKGGVEALMGSAVADCLNFRYVDARPWSEVAKMTGYSVRQCRRLVEQGLDAIDFYGWRNLMDGEGEAEG